VIAVLEERDDARVTQPRDGARLADEPLAQVGVIEPDAHQLDRDEPLERRVAGQIDGAHAALTEAIGDLIPTNGQWRRGHKESSNLVETAELYTDEPVPRQPPACAINAFPGPSEQSAVRHKPRKDP